MRCSGSSLRKLPARTDSTSWHSAGEALSIATARGRLLPVAIAMIFVPFPRRDGPMARPPFLRSRRWHRRTLRPTSTVRVPANGAPEHAAPLPVSRFSPIAEIAGDMSGTADTSLAALAIARRFPTPIKLHSAPLAVILAPLWAQDWLPYCPLFIIQIPSASHRNLSNRQSNFRYSQFAHLAHS